MVFRFVVLAVTILSTLTPHAQIARQKPRASQTFRLLGATEQQELDLVGTIAGKGQFVIHVHAHEAPKTTQHILALLKSNFYDNQKFFRVIKRPRPYLVQFGDPQTKTLPLDDSRVGSGGSGTTIAYEATGLSHIEGAVALATRGGDRDSGDSQIYITLGDYSKLLDGTDIVFGQITRGMDVIKKIEPGDTLTSLRVQGH